MNSNDALLFDKWSVKVRFCPLLDPGWERTLADSHIRFFERRIKVRFIFYLHYSPSLFKRLSVKVIFSGTVNSRLIGLVLLI